MLNIFFDITSTFNLNFLLKSTLKLTTSLTYIIIIPTEFATP